MGTNPLIELGRLGQSPWYDYITRELIVSGRLAGLIANDGLRGQSTRNMEDNLQRIVERFVAAGARVLLAGMWMPPNYGDPYTREFAAVFPAVAKRTGVRLMPFLLDGVAANTALNQTDGIHPTAEGHRVIADRVWSYLAPLLRK